MTFESLSLQFKSAKSLLLLRSKNAAFILSFLYKVFREPHLTSLTNTELRNKLEGFLEDQDYSENDDELDANTLFDDYSVRAGQYVEKWSNAGYLRKYPNDDGEDIHELTSDTVKVFQWLEDLAKREFVGTNSRFRDIFSKLQKIIEQSTESPERRIEELEKKKWEIENEINLLKLGKQPSVINDTDVKEEFYNLNKMARELLGDFAEVEQNFEQIRKEVQRKYAGKDAVKGSLLLYALDALDEIETEPQGQSFKGFWEFLMDDKKQQEYLQLIEQLYQLLKEREIDHGNDRFLKNLKRYLHASGKKVIDANRRLSEKISRILSEKNVQERKRAAELIGEIREMAYQLAETRLPEEPFLHIEHEPLINLFDRWELSAEKTERFAVHFPETEEDADAPDLSVLFDQFTIDKKKLEQNIAAAMGNRTEITLQEVVSVYGIQHGLSEVVGYFSIAAESSHHLIVDGANDPILVGDRKVNVPMIIYTNLESLYDGTNN